MKKFFALLAVLLTLTLCILPCYAEDMLLIAPAPVAPTPAPDEPVVDAADTPVQPDDILIGEATVGNDAPDAPAADAEIEHPVAPTPDEIVDSVLTTGSNADLSTPETSDQGFTFEPANFVDNLYYMGVGMVGIFIVIGLIVLATILLNKIFSDKQQQSE